MSLIEAASVQVKTMADNTLRLTVDIEPRFSKAAFELFGARGTPMALAALKTVAQQEQPEPVKGGELSKWVAIRCGESAFQQWVANTYSNWWGQTTGNAINRAADVVRQVCAIESRAEIDNDEGAYERFQERIRGPWAKHCIATGVTQ